MTYKYAAAIYRQGTASRWDNLWRNMWFCREFAQRDVHSVVTQARYLKVPLTTRVEGLNMRRRDGAEQEGMAKFASLLLPNNLIDVDGTSILIDSRMNQDNKQIYPAREVYSLMFFYIKYLSVQLKDKVNFDKVCKSLIRRKHPVFHGIPDQQLGTALYFYSCVKYPKEMRKFKMKLSSGNGPGTAMRSLANLEEKQVGEPVEAAKFYYSILKEWCSLFKKELRYMIDHHSKEYERFWYLPLLLQDVYINVYDDDGRFDNIEYSEDEW